MRCNRQPRIHESYCTPRNDATRDNHILSAYDTAFEPIPNTNKQLQPAHNRENKQREKQKGEREREKERARERETYLVNAYRKLERQKAVLFRSCVSLLSPFTIQTG